jgi:hypothetical protein
VAAESREAPDSRERLRTIADWIGGPDGRGRVEPRSPEIDVEHRVNVWEADGRLGARRIRTRRMLGAGLAGTVYLVEDSDGNRFVEKHYGAIPTRKGQLGRRLTAWLFALFRQAPLSFRELPQAVVAIHLANRFIVALSMARLGYALTPPILYTRYDERTGGYVQAFAYVEGRPLRPWRRGLSVLGEAGRLLPTMRRWRDFLAKELGFWGLARQVDPANLNAFSNVWITPEDRVLLLDMVPGLPGFLEPRYLWWGLRRGDLPPFGDAVDFRLLGESLERHGPADREAWRGDLALLELAVEEWRASEPRLFSSPARPIQLARDPRVRSATRVALVRHLEVKGAVTAAQAAEQRRSLAATGTFPRRRRHSVLKMAPLPLHRAVTDGGYALELLRRAPRLALALMRAAAGLGLRAADRLGRFAASLARLVVRREERIALCRATVQAWIVDDRGLGRLGASEGASLERALHDDAETADLMGLFAVHVAVGAFKQSLLGPSGVWIALALATGTWWLALPAVVAPSMRVGAALALGFVRRPGLLLLCALPSAGTLAAPVYMLQRRSDLGGYMIRSLAARTGLRVPGFGVRGGLVEMVAVGAAQAFLVDPARLLPPVVAVAVVGLVGQWWWICIAAVVIYLVAVVWCGVRRHRESRAGSGRPVSWQLGLPEAAECASRPGGR